LRVTQNPDPDPYLAIVHLRSLSARVSVRDKPFEAEAVAVPEAGVAELAGLALGRDRPARELEVLAGFGHRQEPIRHPTDSR
jgi:hypothetical protein